MASTNKINLMLMLSLVLFLIIGQNIIVKAQEASDSGKPAETGDGDTKMQDDVSAAAGPSTDSGAPASTGDDEEKIPFISPVDGDASTGQPMLNAGGEEISGQASSGTPMVKNAKGDVVDGGVISSTPMVNAGGKEVTGGGVSGTPMLNANGKEVDAGVVTIGSSMVNSPDGSEAEASPAPGPGDDAAGRKAAAGTERR